MLIDNSLSLMENSNSATDSQIHCEKDIYSYQCNRKMINIKSKFIIRIYTSSQIVLYFIFLENYNYQLLKFQES